jgi:hypothetical protein
MFSFDRATGELRYGDQVLGIAATEQGQGEPIRRGLWVIGPAHGGPFGNVPANTLFPVGADSTDNVGNNGSPAPRRVSLITAQRGSHGIVVNLKDWYAVAWLVHRSNGAAGHTQLRVE